MQASAQNTITDLGRAAASGICHLNLAARLPSYNAELMGYFE